MEKQTPVEWFDMLQAFEQAKEMEKEQQGYSEEEVKKLIKDFLFERGIGREVQNVNEWFEQIKNK